MAVAAVSFGKRARQAVRAGPPHCTGPSGFLAVLASGGVRTNSPSAQTCAALIHLRLRSSAEHRGGPARTACRAPVLTRRAVLFAEVSRENAGCFQPRRSLGEMPNERAHVGGWFPLGRPLSLRRAPQRKADQGRTCLSEASLCGPRFSRGAPRSPKDRRLCRPKANHPPTLHAHTESAPDETISITTSSAMRRLHPETLVP